MSRAARHLLTVLAVASLVLCAGVCGLWVRSYWVSDHAFIRQTDPDGGAVTQRIRSLTMGRGVVRLARREDAGIYYEREDVRMWETYPVSAAGRTPAETWAQAAGFKYEYTQGGKRSRWSERTVAFPLWAVALPLAVIPALRLRGIVRRRGRTRDGLCVVCGYDLRGSPERCPECGTPAR